MADDDSDLEILDSPPDHIDHDRRSTSMPRRRHALRSNDSVPPEITNTTGPRRIRGQSGRDSPTMNQRRRQRLQLAAMQELSRQPDTEHRRPEPVDVIDLTDEPDTRPQSPPAPLTLPRVMPEMNGMPARRNVGFLDVVNNPSQQPDQPRNPRRQMSGLARTPSLSRSDPSIISFGHGRSSVPAQLHIDLTGDDEPSVPGSAAERQTRQVPRVAMLDAPANRPWHRWAPGSGTVSSIVELVFGGFGANVNRTPGGQRFLGMQGEGAAAADRRRERELRELEMGMGMGLGQFMGGDHQRDMLIELDYSGPGVFPPNFWDDHSPNRPKPPYVPPPDAPVGFSRDTGQDVVAICPGCEEELVYDPDEVRDEQEAAPAKKPRNKKDRAEHHFMAIKACGHVYCRTCYERRTSPSSRKAGSGPQFRQHPDSSKLLCAVDDCASEIKSKTAWLGIFV